LVPYLLLPKVLLQEPADLDSRGMDRVIPRTVVVNDVVEFCVPIAVHPIDEIVAVVPSPTGIEPVHFRDTVTDCLD
jgi:hypothetical protein